MAEKTIYFSHHYPKIHGQKCAKLIAVEPIHIDRFTAKELIDYDTTYDGGKFKLKTGDYIQLVFLGNLRIPFCTIRPAWPKQKMEYYKSSIGEVFDIKYKGEQQSDIDKYIDKLKNTRDEFGEHVNSLEAKVS